MESTSLMAIIARCTTIQFADCAHIHSKPRIKKPAQIESTGEDEEARHRHQESQRRTLHRSSRVLRGEPSSAVFRASTGFDLRRGMGGSGGSRGGEGKGAYCLRRVSILRDFCSMRVMRASRFSSASGYAADEDISRP
jgi:hypothetical protein